MASLLRNLKESLELAPRDVWVLYFNPQLRFLVDRVRFLVRVRRGTEITIGG